MYDVIVVGARCAGAATAMLLARRGVRVLVVDRAPAGSDTLSTHMLMRGGMVLLERWGLVREIIDGGAPPVRRTTFHYGDARVDVAIKPRHGVDFLAAPRRTLLDPILVRAAERAGVEVRHGVSVRGLIAGPNGRVRGVILEPGGEVRAGLIIGADGIRSTVARLANAPMTRVAAHASAVVYGYWADVDLDGTHWIHGPGIAAGTIPTDGGLTCVFVAVPPARFRAEVRGDLEAAMPRLLAEVAPGLAALLAGCRRVGALRPFAGCPGFMRRPHGPGWALVGDAGYFKDPLTAHGITDALRDADGLARAHSGRGLAAYEEERDELSAEVFSLSDRIASFAWSLDELAVVHDQLSKAMAREAAAIADRFATPIARIAAASRPA